MIVNFAERANVHNYKIDPIVRSLLDTDFYKLIMAQFIWKHYPKTQVSFSLINRKTSVRLGDDIPEEEIHAQFEHVRTLRLRKSEKIWLAGNTFYGQRGIFEPAFLDWFEKWQAPDYLLEKKDGQWSLTFSGNWLDVTLWEIYALSIINELKTRHGLANLTEFQLDILYARAKAKIWNKIEKLRDVPDLKFSDFGTRRRHSFLWQEYVIQAFKSELPNNFIGTSNAFLAFKHDLEAVGTNAHELPMVMAGLANTDEELRESQYRVLELWQQTYHGALLIMLPDAYGTTQFLDNAPDWVADWTGMRLDSKDPYVGGDEYIAWLKARGRDPKTKLIIPSDGLDVEDILGLHAYFGGEISKGYVPADFKSAEDFQSPKWTPGLRIRDSEGWGTLATNDFRGCNPNGSKDLDPLSLVCKVSSVEGRGVVKLSDNYTKATGSAEQIARYRKVFGSAGMMNSPVTV